MQHFDLEIIYELQSVYILWRAKKCQQWVWDYERKCTLQFYIKKNISYEIIYPLDGKVKKEII